MTAATSHVGARRAEGAFRRIVAVADGIATLPSLEPGEWIVADCSTATCDDVARERTAIVEAGRTALLPGE